MDRRLYIADQHFFHGKLNTQMDMRGFPDTDAMNCAMTDAWNRKVTDDDSVYILGDFSFGKKEETEEILSELRGRKYLIEGNHDFKWLGKRNSFGERENTEGRYLKWVKQYTEETDGGRKVTLCHYPVMCFRGQYRTDGQGNPVSYMLYGHVYGTRDELSVRTAVRAEQNTECGTGADGKPLYVPCAMIGCFCMYSDYEPLTLNEWREVRKKQMPDCRF